MALPVRLLNLDTNEELEANTCDLSAKGLRIVSREYLAPGDRLELWLNMKDKKEPFYTRGTVLLYGQSYKRQVNIERVFP
ncbi:MAG: PilZ domain-containing protein [Candidatus Omnitrophica bacterium]|nr:PilZ domain-containing protein [Candidatus Omnitrophota bacterium]